MTAMALRTACTEDELLAGVTARSPLVPVDGLSDVPMERVVRDGGRYVLKWLSPDLDWVMRITDDTVCRPVLMWETGLYDDLAPYVDAAVVAASRDPLTGRCGLLMRDESEHFVPEGAVPLTPRQHGSFVAAMAAMHAGFWGWQDDVGLCDDATRISFFAPSRIAREAERGPLTGVPALVDRSWEQLSRAVPGAAEPVRALVQDPQPLVRALAETPRTFVHGDWKGGNLGLDPAGRTVLVDWAVPGEGAGCADLAWYLAVNCDRLPESKEATVARYRRELERQGVSTAGWFARQLDLALLGAFCMLGWSKAGDPVELGWWVERVAPVVRDLLR